MKIKYAKKTGVFSNQIECLCVSMKYVLHIELITKYPEDTRKS